MVFSLSAITVFAQQNLRSAYFLEGYTYKYKLNPAFKGVRSHVSLPAVGSLSAGLETNLSLSTLFYVKEDGTLTTFMDKSAITLEDFATKINDVNPLNVDINSSLISVGFWTKNSFHTIDLSVRTGVSARIPGDALLLVKEIQSEIGAVHSYDLQKLSLMATALAEVGYGYARDINDWIYIGGRLKLLYGLAHGQVSFSKFNVYANTPEDKYSIDAKGHFELTEISQLSLNPEKELQFGKLNPKSLLSPNIGLTADIGLSMDFAKYFTASLSVLDIGFINWKKIQTTETIGTTWELDASDRQPDEEEFEWLKDLTFI